MSELPDEALAWLADVLPERQQHYRDVLAGFAVYGWHDDALCEAARNLRRLAGNRGEVTTQREQS